MVLLKVSPWKGVVRFGKCEKLSPRYIRPFKILARVGPIAYKFELPEELKGIHSTFHVSNLKKCLAKDDVVVPIDEIQLDDKLHMIKEPVEVMDREVKRLKQRRIPIVKEVIINGDAPTAIASVSGGAEATIPPKTTAENITRRNELKAKNNTSSTNEAINTAHSVSVASSQGQAYNSTYADDVVFSFFANQSNSLQLDNEDLEQIDTDDLEAPRSQGNINGDNTRRIIPVETLANALIITDGMGYDWSYQAEEGPIDFALMAFSSSFSSLGLSSSDTEVRYNSITELKNKLEESFKEKADLKLKLKKFETSSRNLTNLLNSQLNSKDKTDLGYDSQLTKRDLSNKSDVFESASDNSMGKSEEDNNQANDRYKAGEGTMQFLLPILGTSCPQDLICLLQG
nr:oxoglutarate/iron-dependent dioxygenase [Tanacetum cinerariifolium]